MSGKPFNLGGRYKLMGKMLLLTLALLGACQVQGAETEQQTLSVPKQNEGRATKSVVGVFYLKPMFAHVHQNASRYSSSLTTLACGHPVKVLQVSRENLPLEIVFNGAWNFVSVGPYEGYIRSEFLSPTSVDCFQDKFTKFFDLFELDLAELFYWGRLYDLYWQGKSKVR